jgi:hypothetical protein
MGQAPACNTLNLPAGTFGPFNCVGDQADAYAAPGESGVLETPESAFVCPSGTALVGGVCTAKAAGVMAWLSTGNNAMYAGGAVLGFVLLLTLTGGRR